MQIAGQLAAATEALTSALDLERREARLEAQVLLTHVLGQPRSWLIAHDRDVLPQAQGDAFAAVLARRLGGEPVAYILGEREFYGHLFKVSPAVLIPRPETELLVELALARLPEGQAARVLDLGTGSGAVALSLALARPVAQLTAVEVSPAALAVARDNAARLGAHNVQLRAGSWFEPVAETERFALIVSNPPYIADKDPHLGQGDLRFEPSAALASGADGLDDIRLIVAGATRHLLPGGWLLFEHGYDQAARCRDLLLAAGFEAVDSVADLAGIERVTLGRRPD